MRRRVVWAVSSVVVATALLAGCTASPGTGASGGNGSSAPATTVSAPSVSAVSPSTGGLVGGETATVTGTGLTGVTSVTFNGTQGTDVKVVSATKVTVVVPQAVNYQPSSGAVALFKGTTPVVAKTAPTFTWATQTGVDREMQYAFAHWKAATYNPDYLDFNSVGGDCQNFVSQSLLARGMKQNDSWFYNAGGAHSESWGYAPSFDTYLKTTPSLGFTPLTDAQRSQLSIGDLAYFDWNDNGVPDHVMIVSGLSTVNGVTKVSLVGHNLDFDYRDLDTAITKDHPGAKVWFYKVPASL
jgi:hypothetical protein